MGRRGKSGLGTYLRCGGAGLCQALIANGAVTARCTTGGRLMRAGEFFPARAFAYCLQDFQRGDFKLMRIVDGVSAPGGAGVIVNEDTVGRAHTVNAFDEQAVGGQLVDMGIVRAGLDAAALHLDRDDLVVFLDQVIRFSRQAKHGVIQRIFYRSPVSGVGVNDAAAGQARGALLPGGKPEEKNRNQE